MFPGFSGTFVGTDFSVVITDRMVLVRRPVPRVCVDGVLVAGIGVTSAARLSMDSSVGVPVTVDTTPDGVTPGDRCGWTGVFASAVTEVVVSWVEMNGGPDTWASGTTGGLPDAVPWELANTIGDT